jgi:hypothetical protein
MIGSYSSFFVPPGREIIISSNNSNIFNRLPNVQDIHLIIDSGVSFSIKNNYTHILETKSSALLNLLSNSLSVNGVAPPTGQFSLQGIEIWESTENLSFTIEASLHMVNSGRDDVLVPSLILTQSTLPGKNEKASGIWGFSLIPPGPNVEKILQLSGASSQSIQESVKLLSIGDIFTISTEAATGTYDVEIGNYLTIPDVIITSVEPTYSSQLDEDLCPISCTLSINFQTVEVANKSMIQRILKSIPDRS